jgi:hypothetical protein
MPKFDPQDWSFAVELHQDMQHQQKQAPQTDGKNLEAPILLHVSQQQEIQITGLSVEAPSSCNNDFLKCRNYGATDYQSSVKLCQKKKVIKKIGKK